MHRTNKFVNILLTTIQHNVHTAMAVFDICVYDTQTVTDMYMYMHIVRCYEQCLQAQLDAVFRRRMRAQRQSKASALEVDTALCTQPACCLVHSHVTFVSYTE